MERGGTDSSQLGASTPLLLCLVGKVEAAVAGPCTDPGGKKHTYVAHTRVPHTRGRIWQLLHTGFESGPRRAPSGLESEPKHG